MFSAKQAKTKLLNKFSTRNLSHPISDITKYRTDSIDELTLDELKQLYFLFFPLEKPTNPIERLQALERENLLKSKRSAVLKDAEYLGIHDPNDWKPFNDFMLNKSVLKKPLNRYKIEEFTALNKQFKSMRSKFDKNRTKIGSYDWQKNTGTTPSLN